MVPLTDTKKNQGLRRLKLFFWILAFFLGALHSWAAIISHSMNPDGIAYLDMGEAYMRGDWDMAINAYWSPLYSWLLGLVMKVLKPSIRWEFPSVHIVNFLIYIGALFCFEFFWRQLMLFIRYKSDSEVEDTRVTFPDWALWSLGYMLFIWSSLGLIKIWAVTPDMCVAAFVYLAAGIILRIRKGFISWSTFFLLGLVLGFGYLSKAAMFPLGFVFLGVSLFSAPSLRHALPRVSVALLSFLLIAGPFVACLSKAKGRLTFGDSGKLMYAWHVSGIPHSHWQGEKSDSGVPEHPTRKILDIPPVYEFGTPIQGTFPVSYDPSYWYEGLVTDFHLGKQIKVLLLNAQYYLELFFADQGGLFAGVLILYIMGWQQQMTLSLILRHWGLTILALVALGLYALVHVQSRYIGAFVVLFWVDILSAIHLPNSRKSRKLLTTTSIIMLFFMIVNILSFNLEGFSTLKARADGSQTGSRQASPPSWPGEVPETLYRFGVKPGDKVAVIGYAYDSFWARLARVKIVAEMYGWEADIFWLGDILFQTKVLKAFAGTGAKAIIAENVPAYARLSDWHQINDTNYYIYLLGSN